jgi:hypothetical protein
MSIYDDDELTNLDVVRFETQVGTTKLRFRTPSPPGCKVKLDIEPRPRNWDERKGPGTSGAFLVPQGPGLATATLTIEYAPSDLVERERLRAEHSDFLEIVGSPPPGSPEKKFIINHPSLMMMSPPFVECVFLDDPPTPHDENTQSDRVVFKLKESRKQAPTLSSTTAPGGATREGQSQDQYDVQIQERKNELIDLSAQAGFGGP